MKLMVMLFNLLVIASAQAESADRISQDIVTRCNSSSCMNVWKKCPAGYYPGARGEVRSHTSQGCYKIGVDAMPQTVLTNCNTSYCNFYVDECPKGYSGLEPGLWGTNKKALTGICKKDAAQVSAETLQSFEEEIPFLTSCQSVGELAERVKAAYKATEDEIARTQLRQFMTKVNGLGFCRDFGGQNAGEPTDY